MKIIDATAGIENCFPAGEFNLEAWKKYLAVYSPAAVELCLKDRDFALGAGCSWEKDFLPVLRGAWEESEKRERVKECFHALTQNLDETIQRKFGKSVQAEIFLYLGLCNGAGWVTELDKKTVVLLGMEKIIELNWYDNDSFIGLLYHELGHVYQAEHGVLERELNETSEEMLWQLFTEGVAMVFEQELVGDSDYFHQDKHVKGWKEWCEKNFKHLKTSFAADLKTMTHENQRYFGDWVSFEGHGDVGYYLGAKFVRYLLKFDSFETVLSYSIESVKEGFEKFLLWNEEKD